MSSIIKTVSKQIKEQTKERLPAIAREAAGLSTGSGLPPSKNIIPDSNEFQYYLDHYSYDSGEEYSVNPNDFYSISAVHNAGAHSASDGLMTVKFREPGSSNNYLHAYISYMFLVDTKRDVKLNFSVSNAISMFVGYTNAFGDYVVVRGGTQNGNRVGISFYGGDVGLYDVPAGWHRLDVFIYAHDGIEYIKETTGNISKYSSQIRLPGSSATAKPEWRNDYTATLAADISTESPEVQISGADDGFPLIAAGQIDGDLFEYQYMANDELLYVSGINSSHFTGDGISVGAAIQEFYNGDTSSDQVDVTLNWSLPTKDVDGHDIFGVRSSQIYIARLRTIDGGVSSVESGDYDFTVSGNPMTLNAGRIARVGKSDGTYEEYTILKSKYIDGYTYVDVQGNFTGHAYGDTVDSISLTKVAEVDYGVNTWTNGDIRRGRDRMYAVSCVSIGGAVSELSDIITVTTGSTDTPPTAKDYVTMLSDLEGVLVRFDDSYFTDNQNIPVRDMAFHFIDSDSKDIPEAGISSAVYVRMPRITDYYHKLAGDGNIYCHIYITMWSVNGKSLSEYVGCKPLGEDIRKPATPVLSSSNLVTEFSNISGEPYEEEALRLVGQSYVDSSDVLSPVIVKDIAVTGNAVSDVEVIGFQAIYWGDCTIDGNVVTLNTISGKSSSLQLDGSLLRGYGFIDSTGRPFTISTNTADTVTVFIEGNLIYPQPGEYGIATNKDIYRLSTPVTTGPSPSTEPTTNQNVS